MIFVQAVSKVPAIPRSAAMVLHRGVSFRWIRNRMTITAKTTGVTTIGVTSLKKPKRKVLVLPCGSSSVKKRIRKISPKISRLPAISAAQPPYLLNRSMDIQCLLICKGTPLKSLVCRQIFFSIPDGEQDVLEGLPIHTGCNFERGTVRDLYSAPAFRSFL